MRRGLPLLLALASAAAGLLVAEGAVRLAGLAPELHRIDVRPGSSAYRLSDDVRLGYELIPNFRGPASSDHFTFDYVNAHGFRDRERTLAKPPGARRVLVLGDSVVAGHGLARREDTIPAQLERRLPGLEVLNMGVGGYCTGGEVRLLEVRGLAWASDVVVIVYVENDTDDLNSQLIELVQQERSARPAWTQDLFVSSALFRFVAVRLDLWDLRRLAQLPRRIEQHMDALAPDNVRSGLKRLAELAREHHFEVLVALWPRFHAAGVSEPAGPGEVAAREHGLRVLRLSDAFRRTPCETTPAKCFTTGDGMHPNVRGAAVAADALAKELVRTQPPANAGPRSP